MSPSPHALAALLSCLPIGIIARQRDGSVWFNDFLSTRHSNLASTDVPALVEWFHGGVAPVGMLEVDGDQYQVECGVLEDREALLLWPTAAAVKFAPQMEQLEQMYQDFREIYRNSFDGIFIADGTGTTLMVNEGCERNYGVPASEMIGRHVSEFQRSGLINPVIAMRVIESRQRISAVQETSIGKTIMVTGIPLLDDQGAVRKVIINSRDTTELIQLQEELARAQEKLHRFEMEVSQLRMDNPAIAGLITRSPGMQQITALAQKVAKVSATVLISGESGVGKEVLTRLIHKESAHHAGPFVKINCGAIPRDLLESELFGYEAGAFTGAQRQGKVGMIEVADKGTLFLDEIGELPLDLQVKLLQVLQDRTLTRLGGTRPIQVDVRVVAATNRDLQAMVDARQFRSDLFYRLNVVPLHVPPLRERREDILPLIQHYLDELNAQYDLDKRLSEQALAALLDYDWPGNVRELRNMVERLVVTAPESLIRSDSLPTLLRSSELESDLARLDIKARSAHFERKIVKEAVERYGNTRAAAKHLQVSQSTVVRRLKDG
ncbi:sigma-54-dependent transcriptional activator [Janthinobacterium sp. Marseille]|uniref:HTH-type transcriptional regulatory protein TyrR n=1 Tax=Herminiimonas aquatilis TaxID=345342 RepID=A0ABW2J5E0_9BURK|nr:sigma 54-interacting transcriptional regulator [Janthinobacterium sp. Marseille]ABR91389.1 sigma-54-dependent transcriptional activator [Janthinobacterium sp. Marseille]